jgi:hypothetical protein
MRKMSSAASRALSLRRSSMVAMAIASAIIVRCQLAVRPEANVSISRGFLAGSGARMSSHPASARVRLTLRSDGGGDRLMSCQLAASGDTTGAADTAAIQAAPTSGCPVRLLPGIYYTSAQLVVPPGTALGGSPGSLAYYGGSIAMPISGTIIKPVPAFAGTSIGGQSVAGVIVMVSQNLGGYPTGSGNQRLSGITIDGRCAPAGVNGIEAWGPV